MNFGLYVNQYQSRDDDVDFSTVRERVSRAERAGYDVVAVGERHFYEQGFCNVLSCLQSIAFETSSVRIMSNVLLPALYNPIHLAEQLCAVDQISDGRLTVGVSLGYREREFENFGVDAPLEKYLESVKLLERLLRGETVDFDGEHHELTDAFVSPCSRQSPRPPVVGGGTSSPAIERAASRFDGLTLPPRSAEEVADYVDEYEEKADDSYVIAMMNGFVGKTEADARERIAPQMFDLLEKQRKWATGEESVELDWTDVRDTTAVGTAETVVERIEALEEAGVDTVVLRTSFPGMNHEDVIDGIERFAESVIPQFS